VITIESWPILFSSAYKPNVWTFSSTKYPNTEPDSSGIAIALIVKANAAAVAAYPGVALGDYIALHAAVAPDTWVKGQAIDVGGCDAPSFNGRWRVLKVISDTVTVIDFTDPAGTNGTINGTITKVFERYRVVCDVQFENSDKVQRYYLDPDGDNLFAMDVRNQAQREFGDIFTLVPPDAGADPIPADGYITNRYTINIGEGYNVPDPVTGANTYTIEFKGDPAPVPYERTCVVNSIQPYHHYNEWEKAVDLTWNEDLSYYVASALRFQGNAARLLSYFDSPIYGAEPNEEHHIGLSDPYFISFLWGAGTSYSFGVRIDGYRSNGDLVGGSLIYYTAQGFSFVVPVGTANIPILGSVAYYDVSITNAEGKDITTRHRLRIDKACKQSPVRVYALNKFGAIDAFTFDGYDKRSTEMDRDFVSKPTMPMQITGGDFQRRGWRNKPTRNHETESQTLTKPMLRWVVDEIMESASIRTIVEESLWTPVINLTDDPEMGFRSGRVVFEYAYGVDNQVQTT